MNRLVPGARVLLVGSTDQGLAQQLADLSIDAITVQSLSDFEEANVEAVVDCICEFSSADLQSQSRFQDTADLLSKVRQNGSLCFLFPQDPALTVTALHQHLVPFAEEADQPTGRDTDQIQIEIVKKRIFSQQPSWCLASMRVPESPADPAIWRRRAIEAERVLRQDRSAA